MRPSGIGRRPDGLSRRSALALAGGSLLATFSPLSRAKAARTTPSRGVNVPGWFDWKGGVAPSDAVLRKLRRCGAESIRLPIDGDLALSGGWPVLRGIRKGVARLVDLGFAVLVDMHPSAALHALFLQDPGAAGERVIQAWTNLRAVIADLPANLVYPELLNEPPMEHAAWLALRDRLAETVRIACPRHTLVWGPAPDQGIWQLDDTPPLADGNQIAAVHFYAPMAFTHQCQSWGASPLARIAGLPFPATRNMAPVRERIAALRAAGDEQAAALIEEQLTTDWTAAAIRTEFDRASRWSATSGCPVMLNEFGVLDSCVNARSRVAWVRAVRMAAEASGIGWAYWELDQGFGFVESRLSVEGFDSAMLDALFDRDG